MSSVVRHRRLTGARLLVALAAFALAAAACGDDDTDVASSPSTTAAAAATTATTAATTATTKAAAAASDGYDAPATTAAAGGSTAVALADSSLGKILTSGGKTLYAFTPDTAGTSTCYDACANTWPGVEAAGAPSVGTGLDASLFATSPRTDGGTQVTVDGHPLYFFASDSAPGDTKGQGIGGKWYVVGADGAMITG